MKLIKKNKFAWFFFLSSLFIFAFVFYLIRHFMVNLDELDNILAPYLMSQNKFFYRDIFNMHFPLPFYLAHLFGPLWITQNPSRAIAIFRLSLLFVYFLSFFLVFISFKNKKTKITFSLWIILLSFIAPLYHGNLYLSETFTTIFISSIFWLSLPIILDLEKFSNYHFYLLIFFSSLAFWTQPMLIILFFTPFLFISKRELYKFIFISFFLNLIPLFLFLINNQIVSFFQQAVVFNYQIYSKFFPEQINSYSMFYQNLLSFLKNELVLLSSFDSYTSIFQFLVHLCLIVLFIVVSKQKKYKYILIFITIFISVNIRSIKIIPGSIYNFAIFPLLAISSASVFMIFVKTVKLKFKNLFFLIIISIFILNLIEFSPIFKQSLNRNYNYDAFWSYRQRIGEDISKLTNPEEKILIYPHDSDFYFFSKREPIDIFPYWYPWLDVNNEFKKIRIDALKNNPPALIYYGNLEYKTNPKAYAEFFPNLLDNYINLSKDNQSTNYWLRADLLDRLLPLNFSVNPSISE